MGSFKLSLLPILLLAIVAAVSADELRTFIVHVHPHESHVFSTTDDRTTWYKTFLPEDERLVHSYHHVASGFAARLTEQELDTLSAMPGFVTAVPNQVYRLLTTHTPQFLGLELPQSGRNYTSGSGEGVIIGVLDGGVDPFHPSFSGDGMPPPPPAKWKGRCDFNA
jgi:subtilisin family serine protease